MLLTDDLKKNIVSWLIASLLVVAFILPMYFLTKWSWSNIMLVPAALYLGYIGLRWVARSGMFDLFSYQFVNLFSSFRKGSPKKYADAYEYKTHMKENRESKPMVVLPWLIIGLICLILCVIFSFFPGMGR